MCVYSMHVWVHVCVWMCHKNVEIRGQLVGVLSFHMDSRIKLRSWGLVAQTLNCPAITHARCLCFNSVAVACDCKARVRDCTHKAGRVRMKLNPLPNSRVIVYRVLANGMRHFPVSQRKWKREQIRKSAWKNSVMIWAWARLNTWVFELFPTLTCFYSSLVFVS